MPAGFLVDGLTEQRFIQNVCNNKVSVKLTNLNGKTVETTALAKRVASLIRIWKGRYSPIVVVVDREKRSESAKEFAANLLAKVREEEITDNLIVGVADRMLENWMIADPALWPGEDIPDSVDGTSGASILRGYLDGAYDKAANGPQLLKKSRPSEIRKRSASFAELEEQLKPLGCHWLNK